MDANENAGKRRNRELVKVNSLNDSSSISIHNKIINARYKMTSEEIKIFFYLVSLIKPEDEELKNYKIPVKLLNEFMETKNTNPYHKVKNTISRLLQRSIEIETIDKNNRRKYQGYSLVSYGEYLEGEGEFILGIEERLKPYLLQLKRDFTKAGVHYVFKLRSFNVEAI